MNIDMVDREFESLHTESRCFRDGVNAYMVCAASTRALVHSDDD